MLPDLDFPQIQRTVPQFPTGWIKYVDYSLKLHLPCFYCPPDVTAAVSSSILSSSASTSSCILSASSVTIGEDLRSLCLWLRRPPVVRGPPEMLRGNEDGLQAEEGEPGSDRGAGLEVGDDGRPEEVQGSWKGRLWGESSWSECGTEVEESGAIDQSDASTSARTLGGESGPLLV